MNPNCWQLEGQLARLALPGLTAVVDAARPAEGLTSVALRDRASQGASLLGVSASAFSNPANSLAEWHVRGHDLFAVYESEQPDAVRLDIRWNVDFPAHGDSRLVQIDLLISIRTDQLGWRHAIYVDSCLPDSRAFQLVDPERGRFEPALDLDCAIGSCLLFCAKEGWCYAELVRPTDPCRATLTAAGDASSGIHLRRQLFPSAALEKGVILRTRIRALFFQHEADLKLLARGYKDFVTADMPLE